MSGRRLFEAVIFFRDSSGLAARNLEAKPFFAKRRLLCRIKVQHSKSRYCQDDDYDDDDDEIGAKKEFYHSEKRKPNTNFVSWILCLQRPAEELDAF